MNNPLLSIIIPTRNREFYCIKVVEYMITISSDRIQFVIQDNSESDLIEDFLRNISDKRIIYNHIKQPLSFIDNYNQAVEKADGDYCCTIGDDDIVLPNIIKVAEYAKNNGIDSVAQRQIIGYEWPTEKCPRGELALRNYCWRGVKYDDVKTNLKRFLSEGCCKNPRDFFLPTFYHGLIKRDCLEVIKNKTGCYFGGLTPDAYSSVGLALVVKNHLILDAPFTIAGTCPQSGTASNERGKHCGELKDAPHFKNREGYKWNKEIPEFYSVETIWADSALAALKDLNYDNLNLKKKKKIVYVAYLNNKRIRPLILDIIRKSNQLCCFDIIKMYLFCVEKVIVSKAFNRLHKDTDLNAIMNVPEISDTIKYIDFHPDFVVSCSK